MATPLTAHPSDWLDTVITLVGDHTLPAVEVSKHEPEHKFYSDVLKFTDEMKSKTTQDAIEFFKTTHGLDFSQCTADEQGLYHYQNATLYTFRSPLKVWAIINRYSLHGDVKSKTFPVSMGGFGVRFKSEQALFGTYGGAEGKPVKPGDVLGFQHYSIPIDPNNPLVLEYRSVIPVRRDPIDGHSVANMEVYHPDLGKGRVCGVFQLTPTPEDPSHLRAIMRAVITFPDSPPGLTT